MYIQLINKHWRKPKCQSRMNNQATLDTQNTGRKQTEHKQTTQRKKLQRLVTRTVLKPGGGGQKCSRRANSSFFL